MVLINYASPVAMNDDLTLALSESLETRGLVEVDSNEPVSGRGLPRHRHGVMKPDAWGGERSDLGAGRGGCESEEGAVTTGRAVVVAKGSPMVFLAAHVLSNVGQQQGGSDTRGSGSRGSGLVGAYNPLRITVFLSEDSECIKTVRVALDPMAEEVPEPSSAQPAYALPASAQPVSATISHHMYRSLVSRNSLVFRPLRWVSGGRR